MPTITSETSSVVAVVFSLVGGRFRVRLDDPKARAGERSGDVLDDAGNVIGHATDHIYGGRGYCVSTKPFGGYVPAEQIDLVMP